MFQRDTPQPLREVREALERFIARGLHVEREEYDPQMFGNVCVDLTDAELRLRMTRDRGQYFISIGAFQDEEWFDEHSVLVLLGAANEADQLAREQWKSAERVAEVVARHFPKIREAFSTARYPDTREGLHRIEAKRAKELFGYEAPPNSR